MENYLNAKAKIMNYIVPNGSMIVNNDDEHSVAFQRDGINTIKVGYKEDSDVRINEASYTPIDTNINLLKVEKKEK